MSTVPAVLDAILAAVRTALPGVQVWDGPPVGDEEDDRVVIGWGRNRPSVTVTRDDETFITPGGGAELVGITERYAIPGAAISYSGDPDLKPRRDRAYALADAVAAAVAVCPALDALNATASLATGNLAQEKAGTGVQAIADLTISVVVMI